MQHSLLPQPPALMGPLVQLLGIHEMSLELADRHPGSMGSPKWDSKIEHSHLKRSKPEPASQVP